MLGTIPYRLRTLPDLEYAQLRLGNIDQSSKKAANEALGMTSNSDQEEDAICRRALSTPKRNKALAVPADIPTPITTPHSLSPSPKTSSPRLLSPPSSAHNVPSLNLAIPHHAIIDIDPGRSESPRSAAVTSQLSHLDLYAFPIRTWARNRDVSVDSGVGGEREAADEGQQPPKRVRLTPEQDDAGSISISGEAAATHQTVILQESSSLEAHVPSTTPDIVGSSPQPLFQSESAGSLLQSTETSPESPSHTATPTYDVQNTVSHKRKRSITPPLPASPSTLEGTMHTGEDGKDSTALDAASLTWHESEITGHDINGPDDDGEGINGIGFKPTPSQAYQRAQHRKQQVQEWRAREAKDERERRLLRRMVKRYRNGSGQLHHLPGDAFGAAESDEVGANTGEGRDMGRRAVHFA